jgi:hypothetical protein
MNQYDDKYIDNEITNSLVKIYIGLECHTNNLCKAITTSF